MVSRRVFVDPISISSMTATKPIVTEKSGVDVLEKITRNVRSILEQYSNMSRKFYYLNKHLKNDKDNN